MFQHRCQFYYIYGFPWLGFPAKFRVLVSDPQFFRDGKQFGKLGINPKICGTLNLKFPDSDSELGHFSGLGLLIKFRVRADN